MPCPRHYTTCLPKCIIDTILTFHSINSSWTHQWNHTVGILLDLLYPLRIVTVRFVHVVQYFAHFQCHIMSMDDGPHLQWLDSPAVSSVGCSWVCGTCVLAHVCIRVCGLCMHGIPGSQGIHLLSFSKYCQFIPKVVLICLRILLSPHSPHNVHNGLTMAKVLQRRSWNFWNFLK